MFLALFLSLPAFAVCDFADPVLVDDATHNFTVRADCYSTPGPDAESDVSVDTWTLSLDSLDVQEIIEGTCSIKIDNGTVDWSARARSSIGSSHNKVYRRELDATLRLNSLTVYAGTTTVLYPDGVFCSGEDTNSTSTVIFQVPSTCYGGEVTLADDSVESCTLEQAAPILWTTLTTGTLRVPDLSADNIRDLLLLAMMGIGSPEECLVEPFPAVDITFEREVTGSSTCASDVGKIDGQITAPTPDDPTLVSLGPDALSCADAALDVTVLDCVPTFSPPGP